MSDQGLKQRAEDILRNHIMTNNCTGCDMPKCAEIAEEYASFKKKCCKEKKKNLFIGKIIEQIKF